MESTKPGAKTVRFENVGVFPGGNGDIKLSFRDAEGKALLFAVNNREGSRNHHPALYAAMSAVLLRNGIDPEGGAGEAGS